MMHWAGERAPGVPEDQHTTDPAAVTCPDCLRMLAFLGDENTGEDE